MPENQLINSIPQHRLQKLDKDLESIEAKDHEVLVEPGAPISFVYFPQTCMVSMVTVLETGASIESATVGNEGMIGLPLFHGIDSARLRAVVQIPGQALRLNRTAFQEAISNDSGLSTAIGRYADAFISMLAQSGACNGLHSIEQRFARWLLTVSDRVEQDEFPITQEFLSQMLGAHRPTVTISAGLLERAGFIAHRRGRIKILNRPGLEEVTCECYEIIRSLYSETFRGARSSIEESRGAQRD